MRILMGAGIFGVLGLFGAVAFAQQGRVMTPTPEMDAEFQECMEFIDGDIAWDASQEELFEQLFKECLEIIDSPGSCEYTESQVDTLKLIQSLFAQHAESKIVQRLFVPEEMKNLVRSYTDEFVASIDHAIAYCEGGERMGYFPYNYQELESDLIQYVNTVLQLKGHEVRASNSDPAAYGFDQLRNILMGQNLALIEDGVWLDQVFNMMLGIESTSENDIFGLNLDLGVDAIGAADSSAMQGSITVGGDLMIQSEYENINTGGDIAGEIRLVDDHMYFKLDTFDIELGDIEFDNQYEAQGFNQMIETAKLFQGKYIDIPLGFDTDMMMGGPMMIYGGGVAMQQEMMIAMMQQDRLTTYHTQDNITYAGLNPLACATMDMMGSIGACLETRQDMMDHTDGKGMFFMTEQGGETNMGITDTFAGDWMPVEMRKIANQPILSWNNNEITRIDIPIYNGEILIGKLLYENDRISMDGRFPTQSYDRETGEMTTEYMDAQIHGTVSNKMIDMKGTVSGNDFSADFTFHGGGTIESMTLDTTLTIKDTGENPMDFTMTMKLDSSQIVTNPVDISAPDPSEIVDIGSLMAY